MKRVAVIAASIVLAAGCSNGKPSAAVTVSSTPRQPNAPATPKPSSTPLAWYGQQYIRIVTPFNAAIAALNTVSDPTQAQLENVAMRTRAADTALIRATWPSAKVQSDVETLARAGGAMVGDLEQNNGTEFARDAETAAADAQIVRADLGLPSR